VRLIKLDEGDKLVAMAQVEAEEEGGAEPGATNGQATPPPADSDGSPQ
jgi:hypothetical protein